jgi:hypothetical protein
MQPFNDPANGPGGGVTPGELDILDSGVLQGQATDLDFNDNLTVTVVAGVATIDSAVGGAIDLDDLGDVTITAPSTDEVVKYDGADWVNAPEDPSVTDFLSLTDVDPASYTSQGGNIVVVNPGEDGLDFQQADPATGDVQSLTVFATGASNQTDIDVSSLPPDTDLVVTYQVKASTTSDVARLGMTWNGFATGHQVINSSINDSATVTAGWSGINKREFDLGPLPGTDPTNGLGAGQFVIPGWSDTNGLYKSFTGQSMGCQGSIEASSNQAIYGGRSLNFTGAITMIRFEAWNSTSTLRYNLTADSYFQIHAIPKGTYGSVSGVSTLDDVITTATADNDVNVPSTDPVILRDGDENITPFSIIKINSTPASQVPALAITGGRANQSIVIIDNSATNETLTFEEKGIEFDGDSSANISHLGTADLYISTLGGGDIHLSAAAAVIGIGTLPGNEPLEINLIKGITVGETADHPVVPAPGKGQYWVNEAGEPIFTSASDADVAPGTDYDLTTATPLTLDQVITVAPIDNALTVPSGNPIIFTDGTVAGLSPVTISKTGSSTTAPNLTLENTQGADLSVLITNAATGGELKISPAGVTKGGDSTDAITFGSGTTSTAAGDVHITGISTSATTKSGDVLISGGDGANGTSGDGGDVIIRGGAPLVSGADGDIKIGISDTNEVLFGQGFTMDESAGPPLGTTGTGRGQFWVNESTSPNKPYFTNEDDIDIDLTAGSGVGDVTSSSTMGANKLIIGDDGAKGVKEAPLGSLSDAGALTAIATIVTTGDITAGNDLISTADVTVGADLNVPSGDIVMGAGQLVDGRDVSNDASVFQGHLDTVAGNPHDVEGLEVLSTGQSEFLVLTADGADGTTWSSAGVGNVISALDITDHTIVRGDGGVKGVQESGIAIDDTDNITGVVDLAAETITAQSGAEATEYAEYGIAPYASRITPFTIGGTPQTGTIVDISILGMRSDEAALAAGNVYVYGGIANTGDTDGGNASIWGGPASGSGTQGTVDISGSSIDLDGPLTTNSTIDGIDVGVDVAVNTVHSGSDGSDHSDVADNTTHAGSDGSDHAFVPSTDEKDALAGTGTPSAANVYVTEDENTLQNLGAGTLSDLNVAVADATLHGTHAGGDVTGGTALTIADEAVTLAKMAHVGTDTFMGRISGATGEVEELTNANAKTMLDLTGTNSGDQTITLEDDVTGTGTGTFSATISADAVTYAKIQNVVADNRLLGTNSGAGTIVEELDGADVTAMLDLATTSLPGLGPARTGDDSANYLSEDGTYSVPPGGGIGTLDAVINTASDNDVTIPTADPVILRGAAAGDTPLTASKAFSSTTIPVLAVDANGTNDLIATFGNLSTIAGWTITTNTVAPVPLAAASYTIGGGTVTGTASFLSMVGMARTDAGAGGDLVLRSGDADGASGDGGDVYIDGGASVGSAAGVVNVGVTDTFTSSVIIGDTGNEVRFIQGFTQNDAADHPIAPVNGRGQWWTRSSDGKAMFTSAADATPAGFDYILNPSLAKSITIEDPAADEDISMFFTTAAITVTQLSAVITGTTSVTYTIRHHTDRSNAGNEVVTSGTAVSSASTGDTTGIITTSFDDETIPADSFVWLKTTALTDTPDSLNVTIEYTED